VAPDVQCTRISDPAEAEDGYRVLVDHVRRPGAQQRRGAHRVAAKRCVAGCDAV